MASDVTSRRFIDALFAHLCRDAEVAEKALMLLREDDFFDDSEVVYQVLLVVLQEHWKRSHKTIGHKLLVVELETALTGSDTLLGDEIDDLFELVDDIYSMDDKDIDKAWALEKIELFLQERRIRPALEETDAILPGKLSEHLKKLEEERNRISMSSGRSLSIFSPESARLKQVPRKPTGAAWFDTLMGGGLAQGKEVLGMMAPPGGGKTMGAVQIASELAMSREHVLIFSYETEFEPEYSTRFYSYMGNIPRDRINGRSLDELNPNDRKRLDEVLREYGEFLHPMDMVGQAGELGAGNGLMDVQSALRRLRSRGIRPALVIIDQLLPMVDRYIAKIGEKQDNRRTIIQNTTYDAVGLCSDFETNLLFLHQLDTKAMVKHYSHRPSFGDAAECKSFAYWLNFCIAFGTRDDKGCMWATSSKARGAAPQDIIVQMNGEHNRIDYTEDRFTLEGRDFIDTFQDEGVVPSESKTKRRPNAGDFS